MVSLSSCLQLIFLITLKSNKVKFFQNFIAVAFHTVKVSLVFHLLLFLATFACFLWINTGGFPTYDYHRSQLGRT